MRIGVEGDLDAGMPQSFLDHFGIDRRLQGDRRVGMSKVVKPDPWHSGALSLGAELVGDGVRISGSPIRPAEYQIGESPSGSWTLTPAWR